MAKIDALNELADELDIEILVVTGMDEALIGITCGQFDAPRAVYVKQGMVDILMMEGMTEEEAIDYIDYNIIGAYVGETGPLFIDGLSEYENTLDS